jgi:hypothetical protein
LSFQVEAGDLIVKDPNHSNVIEVLGRNHLIAQLVEDDVHAAIPLWDQGVDLVAYFQGAAGLIARPIQLKVAESSRWGLDKKYADVTGLLLVYVWNVRKTNDVEIYAMTYAQALTHLTANDKYTKTNSWTIKGGYSIAPVRNRLWESLQPFRMSRGKWRSRLEQS